MLPILPAAPPPSCAKSQDPTQRPRLFSRVDATTARAAAALAVLAVLASCGGGGGGGGSPVPTTQYVDANRYSVAAGGSLATPNEASAVTHGSLTLAGTAIPYTATAGHLSALDANQAAEASIFYVAYTADGAVAGTRPVTFFFNGGPGSATAYLHLGSFAPKRLVTGVPATTQTVPFPYVDNADSLIDTSDLVFVDAVGTGLSEAIAPHTNQTYWGVDADAAVLRDFVQRWLAVNGRAGSPLFLYGESYGTTRVPVLTRLLETAGRRVNGVVELSSILDYNSNCSVVGGTPTVSCAGFLPSYSAVGGYYGLATAATAIPTPTSPPRAASPTPPTRPRRSPGSPTRRCRRPATSPRSSPSPDCPPRSGTRSSTWTTTPSATT